MRSTVSSEMMPMIHDYYCKLILLLLLLLRLPKEELRSTSGWDDRRIFIAVEEK